MQYSFSLSTQLAVGLFMSLASLIASTYAQAIHKHNLPLGTALVLYIISIITGIQSAVLGITIAGQATDTSINDFLTLAIAFIMMNVIYRKGPDFFDKYFFKGMPSA